MPRGVYDRDKVTKPRKPWGSNRRSAGAMAVTEIEAPIAVPVTQILTESPQSLKTLLLKLKAAHKESAHTISALEDILGS